MPPATMNHYDALGLERDCTEAEIRQAFRHLSRRHHPDANGGSEESVRRTQALNAAHAVLRDPARRRAYDEELLIDEDNARAAAPPPPARAAGRNKPLTHDASLSLEELLRGATLTLRINDPTQPDGPESHTLVVPAGTAPKTRFKLPRSGPGGGVLVVRVALRPHPRFKSRGSDLRCDLRLSPQRAAQGGTETLSGPDGRPVRLEIPARIARGEILRVPGHGLPRSRGGRGDLLVRVMYRPEVTIIRRQTAAAAPDDGGDGEDQCPPAADSRRPALRSGPAATG